MSTDKHNQPRPTEKMRMNCWACAAVAVLLVAGTLITVAFAGAVFLAFHRSGTLHAPAMNSIIVQSPTFISGPAVAMSLPAGCTLSSSSVDASGGNWWYQGAGVDHLQILIAASKIGSDQPAISDEYLQRVIRIVEHSGGDLVTAMGSIQDVTIDSYSGRRAAFDVTQPDGTHQRANAILLRREGDDLLVVLYGDDTRRDQVDQAAAKMFDSLRPRPTPQRYDVHSAQVVLTARRRNS